MDDRSDKRDLGIRLDAGRRRLIKASAIAPLVATAAPRSAMAFSSALGLEQCTLSGVSNKKDPDNGNSIKGDNAVREAVNYYKRAVGGSPQNLYDIGGILYDHDGNAYTAFDSDASNYVDLANDYEAPETREVLVLYDIQNGAAVRVGMWPQIPEDDFDVYAATPLEASCLMSIGGSGTNYSGG
ncbi:MAG: hypothetical protein ACX93N_07825 [Pseudohaliea sp.]